MPSERGISVKSVHFSSQLYEILNLCCYGMYERLPRSHLHVGRRESRRHNRRQGAAEHLSHHGLGHAEEPEATATHEEVRDPESMELGRPDGLIRRHVVLQTQVCTGTEIGELGDEFGRQKTRVERKQGISNDPRCSSRGGVGGGMSSAFVFGLSALDYLRCAHTSVIVCQVGRDCDAENNKAARRKNRGVGAKT